MNPLVLILLQEGLSIAAGQVGGKAGSAITTAASLTKIVEVAMAAYQQETGQPMDLDKLRPYEPIE